MIGSGHDCRQPRLYGCHRSGHRLSLKTASATWHGAAGADHNHAAALLGLRSKEWGGLGFNQLLFDDSDRQLAVQITIWHWQL